MVFSELINGSLTLNGSIYTTSQNSTLGTIENPFKSIYVSTGTILIGAAGGGLEVNNNGLVSSIQGFASPYLQVGSTNPGQGLILYDKSNELYYQTSSGSSGPISIFQPTSSSFQNYFFTGGFLGIGTKNPSYTIDINGDLNVKNNIYKNGVLFSFTGPTGSQGVQGETGPQGVAGGSGITLYLDSSSRAYTGSVLNGSLLIIPSTTAQTTITTGNQSNTTLLIASFLTATGTTVYTTIPNGLWELNLFCSAGTTNTVSFYFSVGYTNSDGSGKTIFATGTSTDAQFIGTSSTLYSSSLYVPPTTLPDLSKRIVIDLYMIFTGNNRNATIYMRDGTLSHIHTTLLSSLTVSPFSLTGTNSYYNTASPFGFGLDMPTQTIDVRGTIQSYSSSGSADSLILKSNNDHGGSGYAGLLTLQNTSVGATNSSKFIRMNNIGSLELINNAYTSSLLTVADSGDVTITGSLYSTPKYVTAGLDSNQTMSSIDSVIQFTAISDPNGWWKTLGSPAYRFQPSVAGVYVISYSVLWNVGAGSGQMNTQIQKNGNQVLLTQSIVNTVIGQTQSNTAIVSLNGTTDYVCITGFTDSSSSQSVSGNAPKTVTTFNAYLLN